ncbi:MAG: cyclic nucleotide-binding/CBS domain-containing protein [Alphaproteobacteria bacterium]
MKIQEIMRADVIQISPGECIGEAAKRMREKSVGCLVVTVDGAIKGIITDRDLLACISQSHDPRQCAVALHMSRPVIILPPEEDHLTAANVMWRKRIKRLPITKAGKLLGIISLSDLAALAERDLEKLESSTLFVSNLIKTQGAQRGASRSGTVTRGGLSKPADEQTVSLGHETESVL